jgi:hypothetical protein
MIPILAAASAISTLDKAASGLLSQLKHPGSPGQPSTKSEAKAAPGSFASFLAAQGVAP